MTENLQKVIDGLTDNGWEYEKEDSIHIFRKYKIKIEIFWHSGREKLWEFHIYEAESEDPAVLILADEKLSYPFMLADGIYIE